MQGLVECEYQFRNDRWNCTDNRDTARIQTTLERGICIRGVEMNVDLILSGFPIFVDLICICVTLHSTGLKTMLERSIFEIQDVLYMKLI